MLVCYAPLTEAILEAAAPTCKVLARYGIGYDNIPVNVATRLGMLVTNVPDYCLDEVADHTMALLLAIGRGVAFMDREVREGQWQVPKAGIHRLQGAGWRSWAWAGSAVEWPRERTRLGSR